MKKGILGGIIILLTLLGCSQKKHIQTNFEKEVVQFLSQRYHFTLMKNYKVSNKDSLRGYQFFSDSLTNAVLYEYKKGKTNLINEGIFVNFTIYTYSSVDTAYRIAMNFKKEKEIRIKEGEYGPLGKEYQCFFEAYKYLIHLEATCKDADEKEWMAVQDSIIKIAEKNYNQIPIVVIKPCE